MIFMHIDSSQGDISEFNRYVEQGKPIFVLFYMEGCGPCNATRPEWKKLENVLKNKDQNTNVVIADIDQELLTNIPGLPSKPAGFPSMKYIKGSVSEDYEDSSIENKDRSIDSFVQWIESKVGQKGGKRSNGKRSNGKRSNGKTKKTFKKKTGGKWSLKYKRSINCRRPRGFSQKQHCKYGKNKR